MNPADIGIGAIIGRLAVAALAGGVLGLEREVDGHEAGTRTHMLLALGSGLFGVVSVGAFHAFVADRNATNFVVDPSRIASYVAAGIGFLGAGAIVKQPDRIRGLTTAASLWVAAAAGLAAGLGFWVGAVTATLLALVALLFEVPLRRVVRKLRAERGLVVHMAPGAEPVSAIDVALAVAGNRSVHARVDRGAGEEHATVLLDLGELPPELVERLIVALRAHPGVTAVDST